MIPPITTVFSIKLILNYHLIVELIEKVNAEFEAFYSIVLYLKISLVII